MSDGIPQNCLEESPVFQLSLGSKELFHSNYLYWLWKAERDVFFNILEEMRLSVSRDNGVDLRREWENFDLCLIKENKIVLVIENKVKSIPRKSQLEDYNKKISKINKIAPNNKLPNRVLLSLSEPNFDPCSDCDWKCLSYQDYLNILKKQIDQINDPYHKFVFCDYCFLIKSLLDFKKQWEVNGSDKYNSILAGDVDKNARYLRINDLRHKLIYSEILCKLKQRLKSSVVEVDMGFTNSLGLVQAKVKKGNYYLGIQVQGRQYRRYVEFSNPISSNDIMKILKTSFPKEGFNGDFKHNGKKDINSFGNGFKYLYQNIPDSITIDNVVTRIVEDIKSLSNISN